MVASVASAAASWRAAGAADVRVGALCEIGSACAAIADTRGTGVASRRSFKKVKQPTLLWQNAAQVTSATVPTTSQAAAAAASKAVGAPKGQPRVVVRVTHTSSADK
eukprot:1590859-Pleurochrysis_carterae.AAC.3